MIKNYIKTAFRNLYRYKQYSLINILGLAVGIASIILIFTIVQEELNFNRNNSKAEQIYRINKLFTMDGKISVNESTPYPLKLASSENLAEVLESTHFVETRAIVRFEDKVFKEGNVFAASPSIFRIFSINVIQGDPETAINDLNSIAISASMAQKYFGEDEALGRPLLMDNKHEMVVTAVFEDTPQFTDYKFNCIVNLNSIVAPEEMDEWYSHWMETFILVRENADINEVETKIDKLMKDNIGEQSGARLQSLRNIHLYSVDGTPTTQKYIYIFSSIAILILVIACINFMNLATAQATKRTREVGIRKVSGAQKKALIMQFLGESIFYTIIAFFISLLMLELSLPYFEKIIGRTIEFNILNANNISILAALLLLVGIISGSYPAFMLSSLAPVKIFKSGITSGKKGIKLRTVIVIIQFTLAISILIGTGVIYSQLKYMQNKDLGFNKENLLYLRINENISEKFDIFKAECQQIPAVKNISRISSLPNQVWSIMRGITWEGKSSEEGSAFAFISAEKNIIDLLDLKIIKGRNFSEDLETDDNAVIVNKSSLEMMELEDPIGMKIGDEGYEIIGVVENFNSLPLQYEVEPLLITIEPNYYRYILVRISGGDLEETVDKIQQAWLSVSPDFPFEYRFLDDAFQYTYNEEIKAGTLFKIFAGLGIFIACLGLFGLASFLIEQRKLEIGIRKVMGSSAGGLIWKLSSQFLYWVILANLISWPLAWYFMTKWLDGFKYKTVIDPLIFVFSGLITCAVALLTIGIKTWKAANMNPADVLKCE